MRFLVLTMIVLAISIFAQTSPEDFDSIAATESAKIAPDSLRESLFEAYSDALGNWRELADFVSSNDGERLLDAIWLVNTMPHLDRLLATNDILTEHLEYSFRAKDEAQWPIPEEMFWPYILAYRLSYESVTSWRRLFYDEFSERAFGTGDPREAAKIVNRWVAENIDTAGNDFFGGMQSPDMTFKRRKGSRSEISAMMTAILKSLGIPSRNAIIRTIRGEGGGMSWVEIFDANSGEWAPLYPDAPDRFADFGYPEDEHPGNVTIVTVIGGFDMEFVTSSYTKTGYLNAHFSRGGKPADGWEHFSVCVFGNGAFWPLDEVGAEADSSGDFEVELGTGDYVLQCGMRDRTGSVWVQTMSVEIREDDTASVDVAVDAPQYIEVLGTEAGRFPIFTLNDLSGNPFSHNQLEGEKPIVLFFFDSESEPSIRARTAIDDIASSYSDSIRFVDLWVRSSQTVEPGFEPERRTLIDADGTLALSITGSPDIAKLEAEKLPLIIFCDGESAAYEILSEGYNTNIDNILKTRIDLWLAH